MRAVRFADHRMNAVACDGGPKMLRNRMMRTFDFLTTLKYQLESVLSIGFAVKLRFFELRMILAGKFALLEVVHVNISPMKVSLAQQPNIERT